MSPSVTIRRAVLSHAIRGHSAPAAKPGFATRVLAAGESTYAIDVAYHEAGHAAIAMLEGGSVKRLEILLGTAVNGRDYVAGGLCYADCPRVIFFMGGAAADELRGRKPWPPRNFSARSTAEGYRVKQLHGMKDDLQLARESAAMQGMRYHEVFSELDRAKVLLAKHWPAVDACADKLLERGELGGNEAMLTMLRWL